MKQFLQIVLINIALFSMTTLTGQSDITHVDFGAGWVIPINEGTAVDMDENGSTDFYINSIPNEIGFVPIFAVGCFTSPDESAETAFGSRELELHDEGDIIQLNSVNMYDYIDDDRGSGYSQTGGLAEGWKNNEDVYIGVALLIPGSYDQTVHNAWIRASIDTDAETMTIKEWAYSGIQTFGDVGIIVGDTGAVTNVIDVENLDNLQVSPNPAVDYVQLKFEYTGKEQLEVSIQNSVGQIVYSDATFHLNGQSQLNISTDDWSNGIYLVRFSTPTGSTTEQLMISK